MVTESSYHPKHTVTRSSDQKTVWVNGELNMLGRFTPNGYEIYKALSTETLQDIAGSGQIAVEIKNTDLHDWERFQELILNHHNINLSETENPLID